MQHRRERTETDAKAGATRHPSRQLYGTVKRAGNPADAKVGSTQHPTLKSSISYQSNLDKLPSCKRIACLNDGQNTKRPTQQKRRQDKAECRRKKKQNRRLGNKFSDQVDTTVIDTTEEGPQRMTNQEAQAKINGVRKDYAELKRRKDTTDPAVQRLLEEFDAVNDSFIEWEERFVHRISASVNTFAEASYVGRETAHRGNWPVERTQRKVVLTGTYGAVAGMVTVPVQIGDRTIERLQLFVSPHVNDSLTLGRDVVTRMSVRDGRLWLTLYDGEVVDTQAEEPFRLLFDAIYVEEEAEQLYEAHGVENTATIDQSHKTREQHEAPSILEDSTLIQVEVSLQPFQCVEPRTRSTDTGALSAQGDVAQEEATGLYTPSFSVHGGMRGLEIMRPGVPELWGKFFLEMRSLLTNG